MCEWLRYIHTQSIYFVFFLSCAIYSILCWSVQLLSNPLKQQLTTGGGLKAQIWKGKAKLKEKTN